MDKFIIIALMLFLLGGCGKDHPLKIGYVGTSIETELQNELKEKMSLSKIDFYTFQDSGKEVIAYRKEDKEKVRTLINEIYGGPPSGFTGLCYQTNKRANQQKKLLEVNNIQSTVSKRDMLFCVYWEKDNSDKVANIDDHFREIRDHQATLNHIE